MLKERKMLEEYIIKISKRECLKESLFFAAEHGYINIVKLLMDDRFKMNAKTKREALLIACKNNNVNTFKYLVKNVSSFNTENCLEIALVNESAEIVKMLAKHCKNINLLVKFINDKVKVKMLLDAKMNITGGFKTTALTAACGNMDIINLLFEYDAEVLRKDLVYSFENNYKEEYNLFYSKAETVHKKYIDKYIDKYNDKYNDKYII